MRLPKANSMLSPHKYQFLNVTWHDDSVWEYLLGGSLYDVDAFDSFLEGRDGRWFVFGIEHFDRHAIIADRTINVLQHVLNRLTWVHSEKGI